MHVVAYEFRRRFRPAFRQFRKRGSHFLRREEEKREIGAVAKRIVGKGGFIGGGGLAGLAAIQCLLVPLPLFASASGRFVLLDSIVAVGATGSE